MSLGEGLSSSLQVVEYVAYRAAAALTGRQPVTKRQALFGTGAALAALIPAALLPACEFRPTHLVGIKNFEGSQISVDAYERDGVPDIGYFSLFTNGSKLRVNQSSPTFWIRESSLIVGVRILRTGVQSARAETYIGSSKSNRPAIIERIVNPSLDFGDPITLAQHWKGDKTTQIIWGNSISVTESRYKYTYPSWNALFKGVPLLD